ALGSDCIHDGGKPGSTRACTLSAAFAADDKGCVWTINVVVFDRRGEQRQAIRGIRMAQASAVFVVYIRSKGGRWQFP
ncbi:hypothetical protein, partial [Klebsiella pneumoniae]|uniref:hypothetical protein n=1 Tax=Klebsiella pneumoniae TaxID=573 RepID=UPI003EE27185